MYAAVSLFVLICLTASTHAEQHSCHPPNMTGIMSVLSMKGDVKTYGTFVYDSMGKKLRFRSNETTPTTFNTSLSLDLLVFFEEEILYEIDSKNQSCEKKALHSTMNSLDIPDDAKFLTTVHAGSASIEGEGIKINVWVGTETGTKGFYSMSETMGCLPFSTFYFSGSTTLLFSHLDIETEIKDPDLLTIPSFCQGLPVEETPEGTVNSFFNEFM